MTALRRLRRGAPMSQATFARVLRRGSHALAVLAAIAPAAARAEGEAELARQLSNPVAALVSIPFQFNYDDGIGAAARGHILRLNIQPVVPFTLNADWNIISRTIFPVIRQENIGPGTDSSIGLGDTLQSVFLSPAAPTAGGLIWGVGGVLLVPTATDARFGTGQWGIGPTAVALVQRGPWTFGGLANHVSSFAGDPARPSVNQTFLQPFVTYTTPDAWTFGFNTEASYDWTRDTWSVPLNASVSRLVRVGKLPVSIGGGLRYWAQSPPGGPSGWGARFTVTVLLPRP